MLFPEHLLRQNKCHLSSVRPGPTEHCGVMASPFQTASPLRAGPCNRLENLNCVNISKSWSFSGQPQVFSFCRSVFQELICVRVVCLEVHTGAIRLGVAVFCSHDLPCLWRELGCSGLKYGLRCNQRTPLVCGSEQESRARWVSSLTSRRSSQL